MSVTLRTAACILAALLALPAASAWALPPSDPTPLAPAVAAWTTQLGRGAASPSEAAGAAANAAACALGDVTGDGAGDLLLRVRDTASSPARLVALAGPDFQTTAWRLAAGPGRLLQCAPDLNLDGIADPVVSLAVEASGTAGAAGPVADQAAHRALQVLDGATGLALIQRQHRDTRTGAGSEVGAQAAVSASAAADLLPAAAGAVAFLQTQAKQAQLLGLADSLPVAGLTATAQSTARLQVLDAFGAVAATIDVDTPGVDPLALAPIPLGRGLPAVAVLTSQALSPVEGVASQIPTIALHNPDGSLAWSKQLEAAAGLTFLLPRAGDLDLDGVPDLIVETVQSLEGVPASQFQVLSGLDGSVLLGSGAAATGLLAAVPLGATAGTGPVLLVARQAQGAAALTLQALDAAGKAAWSLDVEAGAIPANVRLDAFTGDALGFTDLTGDAVPDVGLAVRQGSTLALKAIDGATGKVAWAASLAGATQVLPFSPAASLGTLASTAASLPSGLLAVGGAAGPALTLLDGATGKVVWTAKAAAASAAAKLEVQAGGDLDKDGVQDLLATVASAAGDADAAQTVYALSGATGATLWANATVASPFNAIAPLLSQTGPGYEAGPASAALSGRAAPLASPALLGILLAGLAAAVRPRRQD